MRILAISLMCVMAMGAIAFAGPYFEIENMGLVLKPSLVAGWDFDVPFVEFTNMSISGDFYAANDNLAKYPSPWKGGFDLAFAFCDEVARDWIEFSLGMNAKIQPARAVLKFATLESWTTTLSIEGYPSDVVTLYGLVKCVYDVTGTGVYAGFTWDFTPTIGLECRWP